MHRSRRKEWGTCDNGDDSLNFAMPYVEDITEPLISTLTYSGGLPAHKLGGHAANLGFWVGEVEHALRVIDGYGERFKKLREGERIAVERIGFQWHPFHDEKLLRRGTGDRELRELRRRLIESVSLVLRRSYKEGFVSETELKEYGGRLDLDISEWRRKKES